MTDYYAANGAQFSKEKAQVYGAFLSVLHRDNARLTPPLVVEKAKDEDSPIHECFEWEDGKAAYSYRLWQARNLINHITIRIETEDGNEEGAEVRAFHHITISMEDSAKSYVPLSMVIESEDYTNQIIQRALREVQNWRMKYNQYKQLKPIYDAIEKVVKKLEK